MRIALRENEDYEVTLAKEIETLQLYLDIQRIRFGSKLDAHINIDPETASALVPGMILQPIVENSIKYVIERSSEKGSIWIESKRLTGQLLLTVKDRFKQYNPTYDHKRNRAVKYRGKAFPIIQSHSSFVLQPYRENHVAGLNVTITIPYHDA